MFTVKSRVYGKATDGRTVLRYTPGTVITDDDAKRAGLVKGQPSEIKPARGLTVKPEGTVRDDDAPTAKPLDRMKLDELRAVCDAEGIDPDGANTRADFIATIELGREAAGAR